MPTDVEADIEEELENLEVESDKEGLEFDHYYSDEKTHPFDEIKWVKSDVEVTGEDGEVVYEQEDVEHPEFWTDRAVRIVASKYFYGSRKEDVHEDSIRDLVARVATTISHWGREQDYFDSEEDADIFERELKWILVNQYAAFNSPVWFNCGLYHYAGVTEGDVRMYTYDHDEEQVRGVRSEKEGPYKHPQCAACLPYDERISTPNGFIKIGELIENGAVGEVVYDSSGVTNVVAGQKTGTKEVYEIQLADGTTIQLTKDHEVYTSDERRKDGGEFQWLEVSDLEEGMRLESYTDRPSSGHDVEVNPAEAALAGWLATDGYVGKPESSTTLILEFETINEQEFDWVMSNFREVFGDNDVRIIEEETESSEINYKRIRVTGERYRDFAEKYDLLERGENCFVPEVIFKAQESAVRNYLRSVFEADGYVLNQESSSIQLQRISKKFIKDVQTVLKSLGIWSRWNKRKENRDDRKDGYELSISYHEQRQKFREEVGFISDRKSNLLEESVNEYEGVSVSDVREERIVSIQSVGEKEVYDIQTDSNEFLVNNVRVHNCFLLDIDDDMESILHHATEEGRLFKYGSGCGTNFSRIRANGEPVSGGGVASGPLSFMRIYDSVAGSIQSGGKNRRAAKMDVLDVDHPDVLDFVWAKKKQEDIARTLVEEHGYDDSMDGLIYHKTVRFQNSNQSVRMTDEFMNAYENDEEFSTEYVLSGEKAETFEARELMDQIAESAWDNAEPGVQFKDTINEWHTCKNDGPIWTSNPCSEYLFLDNTACNLASLRLTKYFENDGFDIEGFKHAARTIFTAQEILVDNAGYPTEAIAQGSHDYRTIGIGYADVGAMLMNLGIPYDSEDACDLVGGITALLTGESYKQSTKISQVKGSFPRFEENRIPMLEVINKHKEEARLLADSVVQENSKGEYEFLPDEASELVEEAQASWEDALHDGAKFGFRNAQASAIAPTGTISFYMDCDTTGIEPEYALVKYKRMSGGGYEKLVNRSVPQALENLGYSDDEIDDIVDYISETEMIEGAPHIKDKHLPVFDCANKCGDGDRSIDPMGHVNIMAAAQPFVSGSISKTINLPSDATVEDIQEVYYQAWKKGAKCISVYRDGSKGTEVYDDVDEEEEEVSSDQVEKLQKEKEELRKELEDLKSAAVEKGHRPVRKKLPDERDSITHKFTVGGHEGYLTVGLYEDGRPGEMFITMSKEGSVISGLMDSFATACSIALQYGVPLDVLVGKFSHTRFEPSGWTENDDIPMAKSIMDYIFRWMGDRFLDNGDVLDGTVSKEISSDSNFSREELEEKGFDSESNEICHVCGSIMLKNGACYVCPECGESSGCSG